MSFSKLAQQRYSVRKFDSRPVEQEKLEMILESSRLAPTAKNNQPQRILVIQGDDLKKMQDCTPCLFGQSLILMICYDKTESWKNRSGREIGDVDSGIILTQMMYQAADLGLGSLIVGVYQEDLLRERFHIPQNLEISTMLMLGYPAPDCQPHPQKHFQRKPLEQTVFYGDFSALNPPSST